MPKLTTMDAAFDANSRHIANFEAKPYPSPQPPNSVTQAFEALAYPKIVNELRSDNSIVCRKAVIAVRELLVQPTKHIQCIAAGVTPALVQLLRVPDADLQIAATSSLMLLMSKEVGCRDALQHAALPALLQLLRPQEQSATVRDAAYAALTAAAGFAALRAALVQQQGSLAALMSCVQQEDAPSRSARALSLLHNCTQGRHNQDALSQLIAMQAVPKLAALISSSGSRTSVDKDVCLLAIRLLGDLASTQVDARKQAVQAGCVPVLLGLLAADDEQQACAAASALTMITLAKEGKVAVHEAQGTGIIIAALLEQRLTPPELLQSLEAQSLIVNLLQLLTNAAEFPPVKQQLAESKIEAVIQQLAEQATLPDVLASVVANAVQVLKMEGVDGCYCQLTK